MNTNAKFRNCYSKILFGFIGLLIAGNVLGQKAELELKLTRLDLLPATGIVTISGTDTTINDVTFASPKNYILKNTTGIGNIENIQKVTFWPNPTIDGKITFNFQNYQGLERILRATDIIGRQLGQINLSQTHQLNLNSQEGILLIQYINPKTKEQQTFKIISQSPDLQINIINEDNNNTNLPQRMKSSSASNDDYELTYTDPLNNLESYLTNFTVTTGNKHFVDQVLQWTQKNVKYSLNTNTQTKIRAIDIEDATILDEKTTSTGTLPTQTITNRFDNEKGLKIKYELTSPFTDTVELTRTQFANEEVILDTLRNGWFYLTVNGNGQDYTLKSGTQTIATAPVGSEVFFKQKGDLADLDVLVEKAGYVSSSTHIDMNKGKLTQTVTLELIQYSHTISGSALSNLLGKTIKDLTEIYLVKAPGDTAKINTANGAFNYTWSDVNPITNVKIGSKNVPGHNTNEITANIDDNENVSITFAGITYSASKPVQIKNQYSENVSVANISGGDSPVVTDANGEAVLIKNNLTTDVNNLPFASYTMSLTITKSNIQTSAQNVNFTAGVNAESLLSVLQEYEHWLFGNSTSPDGSLVQVWKNGVAIQNASVAGNAYQTNKIKRTTKTFTADSITITKDNYTRFSQSSFVFSDGGNEKNATLQHLYDYWIFGTNTQPEGTLVQAWKAGVAIHTGTVSGTNYETNHIKRTSSTFAVDSITFEKANYIKVTEKNVNLTPGGSKKEATLSLAPLAVHDFYILLKDINGDKVTDLTQTIEWADGTTTQITPDANGFIHIQRTEYTNPTETAKISNTSSKYSQFFQVYRKLEHNLADTNYCQLSKFNGIEKIAKLTLTNIPDTLVEYVVKEKVKTPDPRVSTYGDSISITHQDVRFMMGASLSNAVSKFVPRAGAETVEIFQLTFNYTTGVQITQTQLDRAKAELDKVLPIYTLNDGTKLLNYEVHILSSYADPKWLEVQARGYDNMARTYFYDGSPYNGVTHTLDYSQNGLARFKNSTSMYGLGSTTGQIHEEIYQQFTNNADPTVGGTAAWTYSSTGQITDFGKTMARIIYLLNTGTPTQTITK